VPELIRFTNGLVVNNFPDHNPPPIHARKDNTSGSFDIGTGLMTDGNLPAKYHKEVKEFIDKYHDELLRTWKSRVLNRGEFDA
jgi:hypothetical protein